VLPVVEHSLNNCLVSGEHGWGKGTQNACALRLTGRKSSVKCPRDALQRAGCMRYKGLGDCGVTCAVRDLLPNHTPADFAAGGRVKPAGQLAGAQNHRDRQWLGKSRNAHRLI